MEGWTHRTDRSPSELLHADRYTVEELSSLLEIGEYEIRRAAREGDLRADMINDQIVDIPRDAALEWLEKRSRRLEQG